jgi:hypothetical protein
MQRWITATVALLGLGLGGCAGGGGYRATSELLGLSALSPNGDPALVRKVGSTIESAKFAHEIAAASGVSESRFKLHACVTDSRGMINVAVDAPSLADAKAVSARLANIVSDTAVPSPSHSLPGPMVQTLHPRPVIEKNPSGDPKC